MKPILQTRLSQQIALTPQLQQSIRLLQLSTLDLIDEIQAQLKNNPMLELSEEEYTNSEHEKNICDENQIAKTNISLSEQIWQSGDYPLSTQSHRNIENNDFIFEIKDPDTHSLKTYLIWQMQLTPMSEIDRIIAFAIIDAINPEGYLCCSLEEIKQTIGIQDVDIHEIQAVLLRIQQFDPIGVGSRDLKEFLIAQLHYLSPETPWVAQAEIIIQQHIDLLAKHSYKELANVCHFNEEQLSGASQLIQSLNPRPCQSFSDETLDYIIPDIIVKKTNDQWVVELNNDFIPKIQINKRYAVLASDSIYKNSTSALREQLQHAKCLLKNIKSRNETLLKVASCIIDYQKAFLEHGDIVMKPLVLQDIASLTQLHESTISRITNQKYVQTPRGVYELKHFFSSHLQTNSEKVYSSTAIRALIKQLVDAELESKPLSDNKIMEILTNQGIRITRRTVAKYRENLGIGSSSERKKLKLYTYE